MYGYLYTLYIYIHISICMCVYVYVYIDIYKYIYTFVGNIYTHLLERFLKMAGIIAFIIKGVPFTISLGDFEIIPTNSILPSHHL